MHIKYAQDLAFSKPLISTVTRYQILPGYMLANYQSLKFPLSLSLLHLALHFIAILYFLCQF